MDVDLLRPGTVPISPDTSLWFEFLLDPSHLEKHLKNPYADPTPVELISKFLTLSQQDKPQQTEVLELEIVQPLSKRCIALKILALKVAAHLKWNLDLFEKSLPMPTLTLLLKDFLYLINPSYLHISSHVDLNFSQLGPHELYAIFLNHRWVLRRFASLALNGKTKPSPETLPPALPPPVELEVTESEAGLSASVLQKMLNTSGLRLLAPAPVCFQVPSEDSSPLCLWTSGEVLSGERFLAEILLDLALYLVNRANYPAARGLLSTGLSSSLSDLSTMSGLCMAVGVRPASYRPSLLQQFHQGIAAKYIDIDKVLEADNSVREIPISYRQTLELDISSEVANGTLITSRDGVALIRALNAVRVALDGGVQLHGPPHSPSALTKAISGLSSLSAEDRRRLEYYLLQLLANTDVGGARLLAAQISKLSLLSPRQISSFIDHQYDSIDHPPEITSEQRSTQLEVSALERLLLSSYDPVEVKESLRKLFSVKPNGTWDRLDRSWDVPGALTSALNSCFSSALLRNYAFILIAKSYQLDGIKAYSRAEILLKNVLEEIEGVSENSEKLRQLLANETLLVNIHQFHAAWPAKQLNWSELSERCLSAVEKGARCEVREAAALTLLNTGAWGPLLSTAAGTLSSALKSPLSELYLFLSRACLAVSQFNAKVSPEVWDKMVPLFVVNKNRRESRSLLGGLTQVLEPNALSLLVSLLARLHNVLSDQPSLDICCQLTHIWPAALKNASQYSLKQVSETLFEVLEHALEYYPYNLPWLKVMGDLHFVKGNYRSALSSYLEATAVGTDHFSRPLPRNVLEDHTIKRMIKCCTQMQCHTQAGLLCQLLEETDYTTAFKCLSEANPSDASDSYHRCIWDINILEFLIALHAKRGDHQRRQALVRIIGLLELNSNNNEEIKREAENIRKSYFLRALASQYL